MTPRVRGPERLSGPKTEEAAPARSEDRSGDPSIRRSKDDPLVTRRCVRKTDPPRPPLPHPRHGRVRSPCGLRPHRACEVLAARARCAHPGPTRRSTHIERRMHGRAGWTRSSGSDRPEGHRNAIVPSPAIEVVALVSPAEADVVERGGVQRFLHGTSLLHVSR